MSKTLRRSNLQIKSYQRFKCTYCDTLTVSSRCHEFFSRFFWVPQITKTFSQIFPVLCQFENSALCDGESWSMVIVIQNLINGSWLQMKLIWSSYQIIDITMPKMWQEMVSIILIKNFAYEDHEGDGPFKTGMNWVLELCFFHLYRVY